MFDRKKPGLLVDTGRLHWIGGKTVEGRHLTSVATSNFSSPGARETREALPWGWSNMGAVRLPNGRVFLAGGESQIAPNGDVNFPFRKCLVGSSDFGTWTELPNVPIDRAHVASRPAAAFATSGDGGEIVLTVTVGDEMFMSVPSWVEIEIQAENSLTLCSLRYDLTSSGPTSTWTRVSHPNIGFRGSKTVQLGTTFLLVGGYSGEGDSKDFNERVLEFDFATKSLQPLRIPNYDGYRVMNADIVTEIGYQYESDGG